MSNGWTWAPNQWQNWNPQFSTATSSSDTHIAGPPTNGMTQSQQQASAIFESVMQLYGFTGDTLNQIMQWANKELIAGNSSDQISLDLQQTPWFEQRFPGIALRQKAGLPPITPGAYIQLEDSYTQILRQAGLPNGFYDQPQDFASLIGSDVAPTELQDRISNAYNVVNTAPKEIQQAFTSMYGPQGQSALAAYVIDPTRAEPALLKQVQSAQVAGTGAQYGFQVRKPIAEQLAAQGVDLSQAQSGFKQASGYQSLIHGGINEQTPFGQEKVIAGQFGTTPGATTALEQAIMGKEAAFGGGGQGLETNTGLTGLGRAQSI